MPNPPLCLLTRADDIGLNHSSNQGIYDAVTSGIVKNVGIMAPAPCFDEAASILKQVTGIDIGLHITLTAEWANYRWGPLCPVSQVPSLVDAQGHFPQACKTLHDRPARLEEMMSEIRAQLDRCRKAGLEIAYVDEHMGVGWVGGEEKQVNALQEAIEDMCRTEGLVCSSSLFKQGRIKRLEYGNDDSVNHVDRFLTGLKNALDEEKERSALDSGHQTEKGETPSADSETAKTSAKTTHAYIHVGHPAYPSEEMRLLDLGHDRQINHGVDRDWQRRCFMDQDVLDFICEHGIHLVRYSEV